MKKLQQISRDLAAAAESGLSQYSEYHLKTYSNKGSKINKIYTKHGILNLLNIHFFCNSSNCSP